LILLITQTSTENTLLSPADSPDLSRRKTLAFLATSLLIGVLPRPSWAVESQQQQLQSFVAFMQLSRILTGSDDLDSDAAQHIFKLISTEPWGTQHLAQITNKLKVTPAGIVITPLEQAALLEPNHFDSGERWFINHLLTTLMTGIYYHQIGNHVVTYQHALMHTAMEGVSALHSKCAGEFGYWSSAPLGVDE
jgi:Membrane bound FAD containing D-sorbitol dehydrogenase